MVITVLSELNTELENGIATITVKKSSGLVDMNNSFYYSSSKITTKENLI